ncbi:hypothetical protein Tco_0928452 [Tanacetum coccineum]
MEATVIIIISSCQASRYRASLATHYYLNPDILEIERSQVDKLRAVDFTSDDVLDEATDDDGTIELPENFPGTPPSSKLANLKGVGKAVVNSETRNDIHKELGLEGVGGDDDVIFILSVDNKF